MPLNNILPVNPLNFTEALKLSVFETGGEQFRTILLAAPIPA